MTMLTDNSRLSSALNYAKRGWAVLPCQPGAKAPIGRLVPNGLKGASTDCEVLRRWWSEVPNANVGLRTGIVFDVLDIDGAHALEELERLAPTVGDHVFGPTVSTPRGWHCYVAATGIGNRTAIGGRSGLDWRGRNGYVIAPPSTNDVGADYDWIESNEFTFGPDVGIRPAPSWLLEILSRRSEPEWSPKSPRHGGRTGYGAAALERELGVLAVAPSGTRNDQLNRSAFRLGQLVAVQQLTAQEVGDSLLLVAQRIGLEDAEAKSTILSGLEAGIRNPRRVSR
jgi:Bifunctional DNA primase/polymerase, N-terminal